MATVISETAVKTAETGEDITLRPDIPRIEIIQPSTLVNITSAAVPADVVQPELVVVQDPAEAAKKPVDETSEASKVPNASNDSRSEFAIPECKQCVDESQPSVAVDVEVDEQPTNQIEDSGENDLRRLSRWRCCSFNGPLCRFYFAYFDFFTNPKCMLPIQLLLLAVPISCGLMGAHYMEYCPGNTTTPTLMFMIGVTAAIAVVCRLVVTIRILVIEGRPAWWMLKSITIFTIIILFLLVTTEMLAFFQFKPSFDFEDEDYCDPIFYKFSYWMNWGFVALIILNCLLYVPACVHDSLIMQEDYDV